MKQKTEEKQLLADAILWFKQKYGKSPKECDLKFIQVWYKPTLFRKTTTVVFAQTEEAGKAFIWEQNTLWRSLKYFWIAPILFVNAFFIAFSQTTIEATNAVIDIVLALCVVCIAFFLYLAKKCKKLDKIHKWNVETYYP